MLTGLHSRKGVQLIAGFALGILFGFLLQKGGVTRYDVILGQLLLEDFTVVKIMLSAVVTGMLGVHLLRSLGAARLHPKPGSLGMSAAGSLIFGVGFGILGYCPGTAVGAAAQGSMDAVLGGIVGMLIGAGLFAALYPRLEAGMLKKGDFGELTLPELFKVNAWVVVIPAAALLTLLLVALEKLGF